MDGAIYAVSCGGKMTTVCSAKQLKLTWQSHCTCAACAAPNGRVLLQVLWTTSHCISSPYPPLFRWAATTAAHIWTLPSASTPAPTGEGWCAVPALPAAALPACCACWLCCTTTTSLQCLGGAGRELQPGAKGCVFFVWVSHRISMGPPTHSWELLPDALRMWPLSLAQPLFLSIIPPPQLGAAARCNGLEAWRARCGGCGRPAVRTGWLQLGAGHPPLRGL